MNIKGREIILYLCIASLCMACKPESAASVDTARDPVVSVGGKVLYRDEIENAFPSGLKSADSANIANAYTRRWIEEALIYDKARQNIIDQEAIDELVNNYRETLIVHSYLDRLIRQHLDRQVTEAELLKFYEEHKSDFLLNDNIIKGLYLKIPLNSPELKNFRKWYTDTSEGAISNIEQKQLQNAVAFDYFYDRWVDLDNVMENIPYAVDSGEQLLKTKRNIEVADSSFVYLLNIKEYRLKGTLAPFEYIKSEITDSYMKKNETDFLRQVRDDLYTKALSDKEIIFYNK